MHNHNVSREDNSKHVQYHFQHPSLSPSIPSHLFSPPSIHLHSPSSFSVHLRKYCRESVASAGRLLFFAFWVSLRPAQPLRLSPGCLGAHAAALQSASWPRNLGVEMAPADKDKKEKKVLICNQLSRSSAAQSNISTNIDVDINYIERIDMNNIHININNYQF